jgi:hypothetical protein
MRVLSAGPTKSVLPDLSVEPEIRKKTTCGDLMFELWIFKKTCIIFSETRQ